VKDAANPRGLCGAAIRSRLDIPLPRRRPAAQGNDGAYGVAQRNASEKNDKYRQ
jgi:hypothetical protein